MHFKNLNITEKIFFLPQIETFEDFQTIFENNALLEDPLLKITSISSYSKPEDMIFYAFKEKNKSFFDGIVSKINNISNIETFFLYFLQNHKEKLAIQLFNYPKYNQKLLELTQNKELKDFFIRNSFIQNIPETIPKEFTTQESYLEIFSGVKSNKINPKTRDFTISIIEKEYDFLKNNHYLDENYKKGNVGLENNLQEKQNLKKYLNGLLTFCNNYKELISPERLKEYQNTLHNSFIFQKQILPFRTCNFEDFYNPSLFNVKTNSDIIKDYTSKVFAKENPNFKFYNFVIGKHKYSSVVSTAELLKNSLDDKTVEVMCNFYEMIQAHHPNLFTHKVDFESFRDLLFRQGFSTNDKFHFKFLDFILKENKEHFNRFSNIDKFNIIKQNYSNLNLKHLANLLNYIEIDFNAPISLNDNPKDKRNQFTAFNYFEKLLEQLKKSNASSTNNKAESFEKFTLLQKYVFEYQFRPSNSSKKMKI